MSTVADSCGAGDLGRPLVVGTLRGYRTWRSGRTNPDGLLPLTAVTRREIPWGVVTTAVCAAPTDAVEHQHAAPADGCACGIYGWYRPDDTAILPSSVFGVVEASGRVLLGDRGFRAERARIRAVVTRRRRIATACRAAGIEVYSRKRDLIAAWPPEDITGLVPEAAQRSNDPVLTPRRRQRLTTLALALPALYVLFAFAAARGGNVGAAVAYLVTQALALGLLFTSTQ